MFSIKNKGVFGLIVVYVALCIVGFLIVVESATNFLEVNKENSQTDLYYLPVVLIENNDNTKVFEDEEGNLWEYETNMWYYEDNEYMFTMSNNDTPNDITDDAILVVWELAGYSYNNYSVG